MKWSPGKTGSAAQDDPRSLDPEALWVVDLSNVLRAYDERTGQVIAEIDLGRFGEFRWGPVIGGGLIWAFSTDRSLLLVDPAEAQVTQLPKIAPDEPPGVLGMPEHAHGWLWIWGRDRLWRVAPTGHASSTPLGPEFGPDGIGGPGLATATNRWLFFGCGLRLMRVDPETGIAERLALPGSMVLNALTAGADGLVIAGGHNRPDIVVLDPETAEAKRATRVPDRGMIVDLYRAGHEVWAVSSGGTAMRVDGGETRKPFTVRLDNAQQDFPAAATDDCLWIVDEFGQRLIRVHLPTARISARLPIPTAYWDDPWFRVVAGRHSVWVICRTTGMDVHGVYRVDATAMRLVPVAQPAESFLSWAVVAPPPHHQW